MTLTGKTTVVGVIGWPVKHSLSPPMHNAAFAVLGLDWVYVPFSVHPDSVAQAIAAVRALDLKGLNVTIPHKAGVAGCVDELSDAAAVLGAVNTVEHRDGRLIGHNTDGQGFVRSLTEASREVQGRRVAILGAGGAARAVAYAVAREGAAALSIVNRTLARAEDIAELVRRTTGLAAHPCDLADPAAREYVSAADVVIDSTPIGMYPHVDDPPVVPPDWLQAGQVVCDLTYNPLQTTLLRAAASRGASTVDGTGMLVHQGAIAFEIWTGQGAPVRVMRQALLEQLEARKETEQKA